MLKNKNRILISLLLLSVAVGLIAILLSQADSRFHGKSVSEWIKAITYDDNLEQTKQWRSFGPDGIRLLAKTLVDDDQPMRRRYRKVYRQLAPRLPGFLNRKLPVPTDTYSRRMCVAALLCRLGRDADAGQPAMARALTDESAGVRMLAISFFNDTEDENSRLNKMDEKEKEKLLPEFIRAAQDSDSGVRNNATFGLRYFPKQAAVVVPILRTALQDPKANVRVLAAESLYRIDPSAAKKAGVVPVVIEILKNPDDQIAYRAAEILGAMKLEPALAVPALIESLANTNSLVASTAANSLTRFPDQADTIIPALEQAAQRKDNAGGYARQALKKIKSTSSRQGSAP